MDKGNYIYIFVIIYWWSY